MGACAEPGLLRPQQLDCMRLVRLAAAADRALRAQLVALAQSLASELGVAEPRRLVRQPQQRSASDEGRALFRRSPSEQYRRVPDDAFRYGLGRGHRQMRAAAQTFCGSSA